MALPAHSSQKIDRIVGSLPPPGRLPEGRPYPFETVTPVRDGYVERDGVHTYFAQFGQTGPWIVFAPIYHIVHMGMLKATVPYLSRHFRVVAIDMRGNGRSDRPADTAAYTFDQCFDDLTAVLDHLAIERLAVIGHSRAAMTAVRLAAEQFERVSHLILIGGYLESMLRGREAVAGAAKLSEQMRNDWPGYLDGFWTRMFQEPHSTRPYEDGIWFSWATTGETVDMGRNAWHGTDVSQLAHQVVAPTLVIHGTLDQQVPYDTGVAIHHAIPHSQLLTVEGAAHAPHARDPVMINHVIRDFVGAPLRQRTWTRAMGRPRKALFLSSPIGLGHVQRDLAIARQLRRLEPDLVIDWFTVHPATAYLEREGERIHPMTEHLANESHHFEHVAGEHDLSAFFALRTMDEIMVNNFMTFSDLMETEHYDLVIGDEAWDVDYYYHENPELKRQPFVFLTDFVGCLPTGEDERERFLCADRNADDVEHVARYPYIRDAAVFIGNPEDVVEDRFGPDLPIIRQWTDENFTYSGYTLPFDPAALADTEALRARLGYRQDEKLVIAAVGGTSVGRHLLRKIAAAFPIMKREVPELHLVLVTGPRLADEPFPEMPGLEVRAYVHNLYEHLACCDLALVQGGLSTCMELVANRRPFLCFPLQRHFEQRIHVQRRLRNYGADCAVDYTTVTPENLALLALTVMHRPVRYRPVETDGAARAAASIAGVLGRRGASRPLGR
ncbi:MAG: alpha/beta fold hydrolase [Chloroflexota bacterium]|nr:alpha/beta fold hydrolase [Chloroflexota bacterium]